MSTSLSQPNPASSWKHEVNLRLAAHKSRRGIAAVGAPSPVESRREAGSSAALAAARVAARYAKAPSYSDMQASEARAALRTAESVTMAALQAQAVAQAVLADLEAARDVEEPWGSMVVQSSHAEPLFVHERESSLIPVPVPVEVPLAPQSFGVRWEQDMPSRSMDMAETHISQGRETYEGPRGAWWDVSAPSLVAAEVVEADVIEVVEPAQPIPANLIEFPRELVATRKARPRLAEGLASDRAQAQLSIFEVDPGSISITPDEGYLAPKPVAAEWSGMELGAQPQVEIQLGADPVKPAATLQLASMSRRLMAAVVDGALITGAFLGAVMLFAPSVHELPSMKSIEAGTILALFAIGILYQLFFSTFAEATPGMIYAGISLCTFDDQCPDCSRRLSRLGALLLSLIPMGLGAAWAVFDEEHLSWHDRLSKTYQRQC